MDRREFLWTGGAAALALPLLSNSARALAYAAAGSGDAALNALFEAIFQEQVRTAPTFATQLGLDKGDLAYLKSKLDTRPYQQARAEEAGDGECEYLDSLHMTFSRKRGEQC